MKVSELILALEEFKRAHGDLEVEYYGFNGRCSADEARLSFRRNLKSRERIPRFADPIYDMPSAVGEEVCRIC